MACDTLIGIAKDCLNSFGGIDTVLIADREGLDTITVTSGEITALALETPATWQKFHFARNSGNFTEAMTTDVTTGSNTYTQTITFNLARREVNKRNALMLLGAGQRDLMFLVKDNNGNWWLFGYNEDLERGLQMTGLDGGSGSAGTELNGYTPTFSGELKEMAYAVDSSIIPTL